MQTYSDSATEEELLSNMEEPGESKMAKHIQDLMFGPKGRRRFPRHDYTPTGCINYEFLGEAVSSSRKSPPWLSEHMKLPGGPSEKKHKGSVFRRPKQVTEEKVKERRDRYSEFNKIIASNPYKKIAFNNSQMLRDMIPQWCQDRLRTACRSARFELPFDKTILENITPLQFLARYTRLYREQRRRYSLIFQKHKSKPNEYIEYQVYNPVSGVFYAPQNLFPALNTMFGMYFSKENFDILCTALFIDRHTSLDEITFVGVCTFADRLFWTSYLENLDRDTFTFLGPNRSVLEYADFENLKRKIDGLKLSREMYYLLYSLA